MSIVALASAKGSPGATTTAMALSSWWHCPLVLIEADPAGGDLAARLGLQENPGLVGMAAALRRSPIGPTRDDEWIAEHVQRTSSGIRVLLAPAGSRQASSALNLLADSAPPETQGTDLLIDIGRLTGPGDGARTPIRNPSSDGWIKGRSADLFIWVCRPDLGDLAHLAASLEQQRGTGRKEVIVLNGSGPYPGDEVAATLRLPVLGHLPHDATGASALWAGGDRTWTRSALGRASRGLAQVVADVINTEDHKTGRTDTTATCPTENDQPFLPEKI